MGEHGSGDPRIDAHIWRHSHTINLRKKEKSSGSIASMDKWKPSFYWTVKYRPTTGENEAIKYRPTTGENEAIKYRPTTGENEAMKCLLVTAKVPQFDAVSCSCRGKQVIGAAGVGGKLGTLQHMVTPSMALKMLRLYLDTLIFGHKVWSILNILNK